MRTANDILTRVRRTLVDPLVAGEGVTWLQAELLDALTAALTTLCNVKNDAYRVVRDVPLAAGYVQRLPQSELTGDVPAALALFEILANTAGPAVQQVGRELLTSANPDWTVNTPAARVVEWMADTRDRTLFFVNPPNDGTGSVKAMYGAVPAPVTDVNYVIPVSDAYETALWAFVVSFAYGMNTKRRDIAKEAFYMQMFNQQIGLRTASQVQTAPQLSNNEPT
jgi:hypothetical protein